MTEPDSARVPSIDPQGPYALTDEQAHELMWDITNGFCLECGMFCNKPEHGPGGALGA